ncbi:MAG: flagellar export chaperone FliS [Deltaproteobacteria bacterium]|nr:flagellar export chaperone FliS [Deltaproteobacteria bacterium]
MQQKNPYTAYERTQVNTADQRQLIVMLYDGGIRFLQKASALIEARDVEGAHGNLLRARQIVSELLSTLRPEKGGEIGENLKRLYVYMFNRLVEANLHKDRAMIKEVEGLLATLREGWAGVKVQAAADPTKSAETLKRVNVRG